MLNKIIFTVAITTFIVSCKKKVEPDPIPVDNYLKVTVQPTYLFDGSQNVQLDSVYTTPEGYKVKFTDIKFFVTKLKNGSVDLTEAAMLDMRETGTLLFRTKGDYTKFSTLSGFIGVDSSLNHSDPSAFPNESPLNISNAGPMHWGWNPGYIFLNIEGKVDTIPDATNNLDHSFSFHIGTDLYRRDFNFTNLNWQTISSNEKVLALKLDMWKFLHNPISMIDLKTEYLTHTASGHQTLTWKVTSNFQQAFTPY